MEFVTYGTHFALGLHHLQQPLLLQLPFLLIFLHCSVIKVGSLSQNAGTGGGGGGLGWRL